ncbi:kinase-like domain-containing protein, partial [Mycena leptocephala]
TARYQVPEILKSEKKNHRGSDVYAFACVYYETLTGKVPFYELPNDMAVALKVTAGARPSRPEIISDGLWSLLQDCWKEDPNKRPKMTEIIRRL